MISRNLRKHLSAAVLAAGLSVSGAALAQGGSPTSDVPAKVVPVSGPVELSPQEEEVLREIELDYERYEAAANGHHKRIQRILFREYQDRTALLDRRYEKRIGAAEDEETQRRLDAIAVLQKFIQDYPDHQYSFYSTFGRKLEPLEVFLRLGSRQEHSK